MNFIDKIRNNLLFEMSVKIPTIKVDHSKHFKYWESVKNKTEYLGERYVNGVKVNIHCLHYGDIVEFFILIEDRLIFYIVGEIIHGNGIEMLESYKYGACGIFMSDVYKDFILDIFPFILSDIYHTKSGFSVYARLADEENIRVTIVDTSENKEFSLEKPEDIKEYFGGEDKARYVYKVAKKL
jgi:hypothetical protein